MGIIVKDIMDAMERFAPRHVAEGWDNPGLLVGSSSREVSKLYLALDASMEAAKEAARQGCSLIVSHHPVIFHSIKSVSDETALGRKLLFLIRHDISVFSMHTNFDKCPGGMADLACRRLGFIKERPLEPLSGEYGGHDGPHASASSLESSDIITTKEEGTGQGLGFIAVLPKEASCKELSLQVKEAFRLPFVRFYDAGKPIRRIACCPGSGRGEFEQVLRSGVDAFLTGDMGHHDGLDFVEAGISLIDAGHYGLEYPFMHWASEYLKGLFPELCVLEEPVHFPENLV